MISARIYHSDKAHLTSMEKDLMKIFIELSSDEPKVKMEYNLSVQCVDCGVYKEWTIYFNGHSIKRVIYDKEKDEVIEKF